MHACEAMSWQIQEAFETDKGHTLTIKSVLILHQAKIPNFTHSFYAHINDNPLLHTLLFAHRILSQHLMTLYRVPGSFISESRQ